MTEKRYAIVRCQRKCSYYEVISKKCLLDLEDCSKECINIKGKFQYGDTKEQLIRKVAQVLFRRRLDLYKLIWGGVPSKTEAERYYEVRLEIAKEIVEFLGVEE